MGAVAVTRLAFRSHDLYDLDSVNFALGMSHFDTRLHQPHPPGYFLYILLGRLVQFLVHDPNLSLVLAGVVAGMATVALVYLLAENWFGRQAARFAGALFLVSPLAWFHGIVALTYSVEAAFSALAGYLCWRIRSGDARWATPAAIVLAAASGVRPSSLLFLGPLFLFSLKHAPMKKAAAAILVLILCCIAWFLPMVEAGGGFASYFTALHSLWRMVPARNTVFNSSPATSVARAVFIAFIYLLCFGAASLAPLLAPRDPQPQHRARAIFTAVWVVPALLFFTFVFLKFVNSGYLLLVAVPGCLWLGHWIADWFGRSPWPAPARLAIIALCAAVNTAIFLLFPAYCSFGSVRRFERELDRTRTALPQLGSPRDLLIVGFDNHFLGYRHAGYYLPGYYTLEYPEARQIDGTHIFAMHGSATELLSALPSGEWSRVVLFPLPRGSAENDAYLRDVERRLPAQDVQATTINGQTFATAPIRDLPLLFPPGPLGGR